MAAQKVLKKQAAEEEQEAALGAQGPQLASGAAAAAPSSGLHPLPPLAASEGAGPGPEGRVAACFLARPPRGRSPGPSAFQPVLGRRGHVGPSERAGAWLPGRAAAQLAPEAAGRAFPCRPELRRPLRPVAGPPFADFADFGKIPGERTSKLYPSCSPMHSYRPFSLGYQDASPAPGVPPQRGFRHVSCSRYHEGGLVSPNPDSFLDSLSNLPFLPLLVFMPQPQFLPPGFLSALHFLPPPPPPPSPPSFSLTILSDTDKENTGDQDAEVPCEPSQPSSSQEQSD
uniref:DMRT like family B with proline rich C-terminal 1 n=1 Tax=Castor canadensis TaxID=51338 RepID=A0A8C0XIC7_CASCN